MGVGIIPVMSDECKSNEIIIASSKPTPSTRFFMDRMKKTKVTITTKSLKLLSCDDAWFSVFKT
ncbi:hypothetical protein CLI64_19900 [Nostoc sp. CENA543]|uniref:hypothetical protein n=1 Tax=Nostoc sp. CENA543 TaxID=1869241 RepID=UPI000CA26614|nr:hypothetical protein [Nostoc sp. CENA543]AUT02471.1 hypothetical protein CLI64_19900 [Nostoc sp. CENA543]